MDYGVETLLAQVMAGDSGARENLIRECQSFVHKIACALARRSLEWGRDDELSIALIALNEAIDAYRPEKRVPFLAFARIVIQSRLRDYWRKENRFYQTTVSLVGTSEESGQPAQEVQPAWDHYWDQVIALERAEEIRRFNELLQGFGITFGDLVEASPQHNDTRRTLFQVAVGLVQTPHLMEYLLAKKKLPVKELADRLAISRKTVERGRKYIIALALILQFPEEFAYLKSYIQIPLERRSHDEAPGTRYSHGS